MSTPRLPITPRAWQPREMLMVSEFLARDFPLRKWSTRVRLGSPASALPTDELDEAESRMLSNYARWADAVVFDDKLVTLIEAKIRPVLGPLEALLLYRQLFLSDPQYKEHHQKQIRLMFLYAIEDPVLVNLARQLGIVPIQYKPAWLPEYLKILQGRERRAPRLA